MMMVMKTLILSVTLAACAILHTVAMTQEDQKNYQNLLAKCKSKYPISDETVKGLHSTGSLKDESDENAMCYVNCVMEGMEIVKNGQFQTEEQKKMAERVLAGAKRQDGSPYNVQAVKNDIEECAKLKGRSVCHTNYKITQCIEKRRRESGIVNPN